MAHPTCCTFPKICLLISYNKSCKDAGFEEIEKKEAGIYNPVVVAGVTLISAAKVSLNYRRGNDSSSLYSQIIRLAREVTFHLNVGL